jgi:hypothetical protein
MYHHAHNFGGGQRNGSLDDLMKKIRSMKEEIREAP